jgi:predicted amidohydrolase
MNEILFYHGMTWDGRRFTIAGKFVKRGRVFKKTVLLMGVAICGAGDNFIKKLGRIKAENRLNLSHKNGIAEIIMPPADPKFTDVDIFLHTMNTQFNGIHSEVLLKQFNLYHPNEKTISRSLATV